jgi:hypothetical protein
MTAKVVSAEVVAVTSAMETKQKETVEAEAAEHGIAWGGEGAVTSGTMDLSIARLWKVVRKPGNSGQ